jgi:hypothetical protein
MVMSPLNVLVPDKINVPVPTFVRPPVPEMEPAKVVESAVPAVNVFAPSVTDELLLPLIKSPMVNVPVVTPLMSKMPDPLTVTEPDVYNAPVAIEILNCPALTVVPPV